MNWPRQLIITVLFLVLASTCWAVEAQSPQVTAQSAIVIAAATGEVLWEKDADSRRPPASTTKLVTLLLAIENGNMDDVVTASQTASEADGSSIWLETGEQLTMRQLLYGLMLLSGNDASVAIAEHISGSAAAYSRMMTERAHAIGAVNSNFVNPNGLPDSAHYSTARDLATITAYGLNHYSLYQHFIGTKIMTIPWRGKGFDRELYNENKLLWRYEGANGGKTGYTDLAGPCLVATAERNGVQLVAVVLNCDSMWQDATVLLDYGFSQMTTKNFFNGTNWNNNIIVANGYKTNVDLAANGNLVAPVRIDGSDGHKFSVKTVIPHSVNAPIKKGQHVGQIMLQYAGNTISTVDVIAVDDVVRRSFFRWLYDSIREWWVN